MTSGIWTSWRTGLRGGGWGVLLLLPALVGAQGTPRGLRQVTLGKALEEAEARAPGLIAARARVAAAQAEAKVPRALWLPRLGVTVQALEGTANNSTASYLTGAGVDLPRIGGTRVGNTTWAPEPSTLVAGGLRQEVFDFGRIAALSAVADAFSRVEQARGQAAQLDVRLGVKEAFFAVRAAKGVLHASEEAFVRAKAHRDFAEAGVRNGLRPPIELARAEADLSRFEVGQLRARGGLQVAQSFLAAAVGSSEPALDASDGSEVPAMLRPLEQALDRAEASAPDILAARAEQVAQAARTHVLTESLLPTLELSATVSGRAGGNLPSSGMLGAGGGGVPNWDAALVFSWPLLDFGTLAQRSASREQERARGAEVEAARQRVRTDVQQLWESVQLAQETLPALQRAADAAKFNQAQADARFRGGLGTSVELADAEGLRTDAEIQFALGQFEVLRSQARLGRAISEEE